MKIMKLYKGIGQDYFQCYGPTFEGRKETMSLPGFFLCVCVCCLHMQMQTLCRAIETLITTSCSTIVKIFCRDLTEVFIASPFCDSVHEGQVKHSHLSRIFREPQ